MWNKKGATLIEALFAFEIYISVLIIFTGLFHQTFQQEKRLQQYYQIILEKEETLSYTDDYITLIEMVLH